MGGDGEGEREYIREVSIDNIIAKAYVESKIVAYNICEEASLISSWHVHTTYNILQVHARFTAEHYNRDLWLILAIYCRNILDC